MALLFVPLSLPAPMAEAVLLRELRHREVLTVKVCGRSMVIEHEGMSHESAAGLLSCIEGPIIV